MRIGIAADHAGFELKQGVAVTVQGRNIKVKDFGAYRFDLNDDYPD